MATHNKTDFTKIVYKSHQGNNKNPQQAAANPEEGGKSDFQSCHITILKMFSFQQKTYEACKETRKHGPFSGKKKKLREAFPEEVQTLDLLNKDYKSTVLNMLKQLKETINKRPKANQDKDASPIENVSIDRNQKKYQNKF